MSKLKLTFIILAIILFTCGAFIAGTGFDVHKVSITALGFALLIIGACFGIGALDID